jgi:hypothetical protein
MSKGCVLFSGRAAAENLADSAADPLANDPLAVLNAGGIVHVSVEERGQQLAGVPDEGEPEFAERLAVLTDPAFANVGGGQCARSEVPSKVGSIVDIMAFAVSVDATIAQMRSR